jgi:putative protease
MEVEIGEVTHYFGNIKVAVLEINAEVKIGDEIHIQGHTSDLTQKVASMQVDYKEVETADPGADVAVLVDGMVRAGDAVFKVEGD